MTNRTIKARPPRRPEVIGREKKPTSAGPDQTTRPQVAAPISAGRTPRRAKTSSNTRRRIHVTVSRAVASELRTHTSASGESNTEVLIEAYERVGSVTPPDTADRPFARRRRPQNREGIYFYLASSEITYIDAGADAAGFDTRSAHIDAVLDAHQINS